MTIEIVSLSLSRNPNNPGPRFVSVVVIVVVAIKSFLESLACPPGIFITYGSLSMSYDSQRPRLAGAIAGHVRDQRTG